MLTAPLTKPVLLCEARGKTCNAAELYEVKKLIGVTTLTSKAVFHLASQSSTGFVSGAVSMNRAQALLLCIPAVMQQSCMR